MSSVAFIGSIREGRTTSVVAAAITATINLPDDVRVMIVQDRPGVNAIITRAAPMGLIHVQRGSPLEADYVVLLGGADDEWLEDICRQVSEKLLRVPLPPYVQWKGTSSGNPDG